jgi:hypothetical protein
MSQTQTQRQTLKGAATLTALKIAIAERLQSSLFQAPQLGAVASGMKATTKEGKSIPAKNLRVYKGEGNTAFPRTNGKSVWTLRTNCFNVSFADAVIAVKEMYAEHTDVDSLRDAFYAFMDENTYEANIWSDNPNIATILQGASIEGVIKLDEWVDKDTAELRSKVVLESIKDVTVRVNASGASDDAIEELLSMADDTVVVAKKAAPAKKAVGAK